jgi:hypothetical protein
MRPPAWLGPHGACVLAQWWRCAHSCPASSTHLAELRPGEREVGRHAGSLLHPGVAGKGRGEGLGDVPRPLPEGEMPMERLDPLNKYWRGQRGFFNKGEASELPLVVRLNRYGRKQGGGVGTRLRRLLQRREGGGWRMFLAGNQMCCRTQFWVNEALAALHPAPEQQPASFAWADHGCAIPQPGLHSSCAGVPRRGSSHPKISRAAAPHSHERDARNRPSCFLLDDMQCACECECAQRCRWSFHSLQGFIAAMTLR